MIWSQALRRSSQQDDISRVQETGTIVNTFITLNAVQQPLARQLLKMLIPTQHDRTRSTTPSAETPWTRLSAAYQYATSPVDPGKEVPDAPAELKEWGQQTAVGLYFGLLVGGSRQYFRHRSAGPWQPPPDPTLNTAALARLQAEESSRRLVRIANETLKGGLRFGALAGTFCAVQQVSSIARAERGAADVLVAGTVTGAIFGATVLGSKGVRLRSSVKGTALGFGAGAIGGLLQDWLIRYLPDEEQKRYHAPPSIPTNAQQQRELEDKADERRHPPRRIDATAAVIAQLQSSLDRGRSTSSNTPRPDA